MRDTLGEKLAAVIGLRGGLGLRGKLTVPFVIVFTASIIFLTAGFVRTERAALMDAINTKASGLVKNLATIIADNFAMAEYDAIQKRVISAKEADDDVAYAIVVGADGKCIASTNPDQRGGLLLQHPFDAQAMLFQEFTRRETSTAGVFEVAMPIQYSKQRVGTLRMGISTKDVDLLVRKSIVAVGSMALLALVLGSGVYVFVARMLAQPLESVVDRLTELARGEADLRLRLPVTSRDEVGRLASQFNAFLESMARLVGQIRGASDQIGGSSKILFEITKQSSQIIAGSVDVMTQIAQSSGQVAANTQIVAESLQQMGGNASRGSQLAQEVFEKTKEMQQSAASAVTLILELGECSKKIGSIIDVITKLTNQTNLLSLNAAIEAARAGQAGQGFTVVADEIRRLADTSAQNAQRIYGLIKEVQEKTNRAIQVTRIANERAAAGHKLTEESVKLFVNIATEVERVNAQMTQVAANTGQVAASTEQATASSEEHSASMEQVALKSQELDQVVSTLRSLVAQFRA